MRTPICDLFGIELPLFAFSHCRDVVAAVTNAGGFGVLGVSTMTPDELEQELTWIDQQVKGKPYGADILIPDVYEGKGQDIDIETLAAMIPEQHFEFIDKLLTEHGVELAGHQLPTTMPAISDEVSTQLLDIAFAHPIKLIANALGVPPQFMVDRAKAEGVQIAALVGAKQHAVRQVNAGVDIIVAAGTEAGGHCGDVTTMVLIPEIVDAVKEIRDVPVLAAGGIVTGRQMAACMAMGAAGAWTGSVWLTTEEAETAPTVKQKMVAATSRDTVRSKSRTGKYSRQLRSAWTDAWNSPDAPTPLPMPLQSMLSEPALRRIDRLADGGHPGAQEIATYWVGQGVGLMNSIRPVRDVVYEWAEDFAAAAERLCGTLDD
jgi:NAD(P)H-dependent flavin oxidoreductase YrpB (nitropropane dioxygenase family)